MSRFDSQLLVRLREASSGHIAINGDDGPNLFHDAILEIERLMQVERLARSVFEPIPINDHDYSYGQVPDLTTSGASAARVKNARKLGVVLGVFKESK